MSEKKQLTEADLYVGRQVEGQQKDYKTTARRYLDFSPFEDRLKHVDKVRNQTIGQMAIEADVASIQKTRARWGLNL